MAGPDSSPIDPRSNHNVLADPGYGWASSRIGEILAGHVNLEEEIRQIHRTTASDSRLSERYDPLNEPYKQ